MEWWIDVFAVEAMWWHSRLVGRNKRFGFFFVFFFSTIISILIWWWQCAGRVDVFVVVLDGGGGERGLQKML